LDTPGLNAIARRCFDYLKSGTTAMADEAPAFNPQRRVAGRS
jgi:hypothetical protein